MTIEIFKATCYVCGCGYKTLNQGNSLEIVTIALSNTTGINYIFRRKKLTSLSITTSSSIF